MSWCVGVEIGRLGTVALLQDDAGTVSPVPVEQLLTEGVPRIGHQRKFVFEGDFALWGVADASVYLEALGFPPIDCSVPNRHEVLSIPGPKGLTLYVPTLVLLRAFLRPASPVFSTAFTPASIDQVSFVDYSADPPRVVIDEKELKVKSMQRQGTDTADRPVVWMQTSRSARRMVQSVHTNALNGWLRLTIPQGNVRIGFEGAVVGDKALVSRATVSSAFIPANDSITQTVEAIAFRADASGKRDSVGSEYRRAVPLRAGGEATLSDAEWVAIEPILIRKPSPNTTHSHRDRLDLILRYLNDGQGWRPLETNKLRSQTLALALRRWTSDGRLGAVIDKLAELRGDAD